MRAKQPTRPTNEITQQYNSGLVTIYSVEDSAKPGYRSAPKLTEKAVLRYEERRLGINRLYQARQSQIELERLIRVQRRPDIHTQDLAKTEDGRLYRIDTVQSVSDVWPPSLDLSLAKTEQTWEVGK